MKNNIKYLLFILILIVVLTISVFVHIYIIDQNRMEDGEDVLFSTWGNKEYKSKNNITAIAIEMETIKKNYIVILNLNIEDKTGEYLYYVIDELKMDNPTVVKINKDYKLEENKTYEFELYGAKIDMTDSNISNIFKHYNVTNIKEI